MSGVPWDAHLGDAQVKNAKYAGVPGGSSDTGRCARRWTTKKCKVRKAATNLVSGPMYCKGVDGVSFKNLNF